MQSDKILDTSGLMCPMPLLKARQMLNKMDAGQLLQVICTDPATQHDFVLFAKMTGHELVNMCLENEKFIFFIRVCLKSAKGKN